MRTIFLPAINEAGRISAACFDAESGCIIICLGKAKKKNLEATQCVDYFDLFDENEEKFLAEDSNAMFKSLRRGMSPNSVIAMADYSKAESRSFRYCSGHDNLKTESFSKKQRRARSLLRKMFHQV